MSTAMIKSDLQKIPVMDKFARHLKYYERQRRLLQARETQSSLIENRKRFLEAQNRVNYQSEFNRLVGALNVNGHAGETADSRKQKRDRIKDLLQKGATLKDTMGIHDTFTSGK